MMGIDDMVIGLAISYVAGNVPLIKNWFSGNPSLQKEMDKCYEKALKKWVNFPFLYPSLKIGQF